MTSTLGRKSTDPDYGLGEYVLDAGRSGLVDEQELTGRLIRTFAMPSYHPPRLPAVALELLSLSRRPDAEFKAMESLLERDAMLAGEVLSIARSAYYSGIRPVATLGAALVRIGLTKLREVVMQAALNLRVFRSACYAACMERLQFHSQATANLCRMLSRYAPVTQDRAFLCGLLHDVGIAGILLVLGDVKRGGTAPDLAVMWPAIDAAHARAGARMVELWKLPPETATAVAAHHQVSVDGADEPMAATLCLAEALAVELDLALIPSPDGGGANEDLDKSGLLAHGRIDRSDANVLERARRVLALDESKLERIRGEVRQWAESAGAPAGRTPSPSRS